MTQASEFTLYGKGIFTTVAVHDGKPFMWEKHWHRLAENASGIRMNISSIDEKGLRGEVDAKIYDAGQSVGKVRITLADNAASLLWRETLEKRISVSILTGMRRELRNITIGVSPYPINSRSPLVGIKSCNYLEPILSLDEAKGRGFHEAVRVNERGFVTSACMANVFWVKGGELFTPALTTGCLAGTTREFVRENIECAEVEVGIEALNNANAIFLTSAGIGIVRVAEFDGHRLIDAKHPIQRLWPPSSG